MSKVANFCAVAVALLAALAGTYIYTINQVSPRVNGDAVVPVARARQLPWHNYSGTDLTGKVALVTGGSTGIGRAVAVELYKLGADVVITSRSERRASAAAAAIENEDKTSSGSVTGMSLQLASNANVRAFVAKFKAEVLSSGRLLTFLVENAGMTPNIDQAPLEMSADGYGALYASNYLGHFLLTKELLPSLEAAAEAGEDVRITATSSIAHWNHDSDLEALLPLGGRLAKSFDENTLGPLEGFKQYGNTKLLQIHMCFELQRRLAGRHLSEKITVTPLAPGLVATAIGQSKREGAKDAPFLPGGVDAATGAKTTMHALLAPDMRGQTNIFVQPYWSPLHQGSALPLGGFLGVILPFEMLNQKNTWGLHRWVAHVDAYDEDFAKRLWDESEEVVRA